MNYKFLIEKMKKIGIVFANGLTNEEFEKIEKIYNIKFPQDLRDFLSIGLPFAQYTTHKLSGKDISVHYYYYDKPFPIWNDFSDKNITKIKNWISSPKTSLKEEYENAKKDEQEFNIFLNDLGLSNDKNIKDINKEFDDFVNTKLENTIPVFAHRYILQKENSPILSIWEANDIAPYGENLYEYLNREFLGKNSLIKWENLNLGYWHEVVFR